MHYIYCMRRDPQSFSHLCGLLLGAKAPRIVWVYTTSLIRLDFQDWAKIRRITLPLKSPAPTALGLFHLTRNKLRSTSLDWWMEASRIVWWYATFMIPLDFQDWVGVLCTRRLVFQRTQAMEKRS